jgi:hypothetical protein
MIPTVFSIPRNDVAPNEKYYPCIVIYECGACGFKYGALIPNIEKSMVPTKCVYEACTAILSPKKIEPYAPSEKELQRFFYSHTHFRVLNSQEFLEEKRKGFLNG